MITPYDKMFDMDIIVILLLRKTNFYNQFAVAINKIAQLLLVTECSVIRWHQQEMSHT